MSQLAMHVPSTVESVVRTRRNGPLIAAAAQLWIKSEDVVLDMTYGRGLFWTNFQPQQFIAHDLITDGVDFRALPEPNGSVDVAVFDPPYIAQGGRETSTLPDFLDRYGLDVVPKTTKELDDLVWSGMAEATRVLRPGGRLFVKCMDYINGARYIQARHTFVGFAMELGLVQVDEFIHHSGTGPQPPRNRQLHSRRAHSFLCIFRKPMRP